MGIGSTAAKAVYVTDDEGAGLLGEGSLLAALNEWKLALELFDSADEPIITELASIRLEAAHRKFGCLAAEYK